MIDQQLIDMLDDPNPQVRSNAVKQLAKTKTQEAVQYLAAVYKTDTDPAVRELARKGGLYIKKKMTEEQWTGGDADPNYVEEEPEPVEEIKVSPRAVEASKGQMDSAMNLHVAGDDEKAATYVERAFKTNPNLKNDPYYLGLASTILGVPGEQVPDLLLGDVEYGPKGKPKRKRKAAEGDDEVTTETAIIDLVIFWVVTAAILIIGTLILFQLFSNLLGAVMASPEFTEGVSASEIAQVQEQLAMGLTMFVGAGMISTIIGAAINSVFYVIALLILYALFHFAATSILGGVGSFKGLIHQLTNLFTFSTAAYTIFIYFMLFQLANQIVMTPEDPNAYLRIVNMMSSGMFLAGIAFTFFVSQRIGKNYDFSTGKGCITIIISYVLMLAFSCACMFVLYSAAGQMVANMAMAGNGGF